LNVNPQSSCFVLSSSAECLYRSDRTADNATYYTPDWIPAAHAQTAKRATRYAKQNITNRML
jgi:hypothetical protein